MLVEVARVEKEIDEIAIALLDAAQRKTNLMQGDILLCLSERDAQALAAAEALVVDTDDNTLGKDVHSFYFIMFIHISSGIEC